MRSYSTAQGINQHVIESGEVKLNSTASQALLLVSSWLKYMWVILLAQYVDYFTSTVFNCPPSSCVFIYI